MEVWHPIRTGDTLDGETNEPELAARFEGIQRQGLMALGLACTEWTALVLKDRVRPEDWRDLTLAIEAGWYGLLEPSHLAYPPKFSYPVGGTADEDAQGALKLAAMQLSQCHRFFREGDDGSVRVAALGSALLARHVIRKQKAFDAWLDRTLTWLATAHPRKRKHRETAICRHSFLLEPVTPEACAEALRRCGASPNHYIVRS